jgi:hypothetical protein
MAIKAALTSMPLTSAAWPMGVALTCSRVLMSFCLDELFLRGPMMCRWLLSRREAPQAWRGAFADRIAGSAKEAQVAMVTALAKRLSIPLGEPARPAMSPLVEGLWQAREASRSQPVQWAVDQAVVHGLRDGGLRSLRAVNMAGYQVGRRRFSRARKLAGVAPARGGRARMFDSPRYLALVDKV